MNEVDDQLAVRKSALDEIHTQLGARMVEQGGWRLPLSYGNTQAEYSVVRDGGAGLIDLSSRGLVEVSGSEAVQFLNGLITNDVKTLEELRWMRAAFPNVQGRLLAETRVLRLEDGRFLFDTEATTHERVLKILERFTLAGDFRVRDLTDEKALVSLQGARASDVVRMVFGDEASELERGRVLAVEWNDRKLHLIRTTHTAEDGFDLFVAAGDASALWTKLHDAGACPVGHDAFDVLRIEAGVPRFGADVDETNVVLEAVPDEAVSFTKGCYVGQEIIARIHWRGHVAKKLAGLNLEGPSETKRDDKIRTADGKEIGRITSTTFSPRLNRLIALAYVKYDYLTPGTKVRVVSSDEEHDAYVSELPFVRGTWYEATGGAPEQRGESRE